MRTIRRGGVHGVDGRWSRGAMAAVLALTADAGCGQGGCGRHPPPVLFDGGESARDAATGLIPGPGENPDGTQVGDAGPTLAVVSNAVPGDGSALTLDGVTARAPEGERFVRYLATDGDGDGDRDAVVTRARADGSVAGFSYLRREPAGFTVVTPAGAEPQDARCAGAQLRALSARSVVVTYECAGGAGTAPGDDGGGPVISHPAASEHLVVALGVAPQVRMRVALLAPWEVGSALDVTVDAADRDGDGHDDVAISLGARRAGEPPEAALRAQVVLFDRQGAYVRDVSQPEASFAEISAALRATANRRRGLEGTATFERLVRLQRALCRESGAPRLRFGAETGVSCAGSEALPAAGEGGARAWAAVGELPAAWALTLRDTVGTQVAATSPRFLAELRRATPAERGLSARPGPFLGEALATAPMVHATALSFDPPAAPLAVMVRGPTSARVDLATMQKADGEPGSVLDLALRSPDGAYILQGFFVTCDGLVAAFCPANSTECNTPAPRPDAIPVGAVLGTVSDLLSQERSAACVRDPGVVPPARALDVRALGWGRDGLVVEHMGRLLRVTPGRTAAVPVTPGAALGPGYPLGCSITPGGEFVVAPGSEGLFVRDRQGHWHSWAAPPLVGRYRQLTDLAISADGRAVAGLYAGQLWVVDHGAPAGSAAGPTFEPGAPPPDGS